MYDTLFGYLDDVLLLVIVLLPTVTAIYLAGKALVFALLAGADVVRALKGFFRAVREMFDSVNDPFVVALAVKTGRKPKVIVAQLTGLLGQVESMLPGDD